MAKFEMDVRRVQNASFSRVALISTSMTSRSCSFLTLNEALNNTWLRVSNDQLLAWYFSPVRADRTSRLCV
jgi:hypothetical protein